MAKYAFKKSRELGKRLWLSLKIAAGTGAVILTLDIISAVSDWVVSSRENTIASQTPEVTRVENNQQLLDKLNQFYNQELKPFELLDILNEVRPRSIYFTDVISQNFNDIEVRGMASNVEEVNAYTSTLDEAPEVISVELIDILTRQGQVNFTLKAKIDINPPETLPALDDPGKQFEEDAEMSPTEVEQLKESASPENNQPETNP
jgi:Tfp pilus assembly protein PilN